MDRGSWILVHVFWIDYCVWIGSGLYIAVVVYTVGAFKTSPSRQIADARFPDPTRPFFFAGSGNGTKVGPEPGQSELGSGRLKSF